MKETRSRVGAPPAAASCSSCATARGAMPGSSAAPCTHAPRHGASARTPWWAGRQPEPTTPRDQSMGPSAGNAGGRTGRGGERQVGRASGCGSGGARTCMVWLLPLPEAPCVKTVAGWPQRKLARTRGATSQSKMARPLAHAPQQESTLRSG